MNQVKRLDTPVAADLVSAMLRAMTENINYEPVVQMGASSVLVAIGHEHLDLVSPLQANNNNYRICPRVEYNSGADPITPRVW